MSDKTKAILETAGVTLGPDNRRQIVNVYKGPLHIGQPLPPASAIIYSLPTSSASDTPAKSKRKTSVPLKITPETTTADHPSEEENSSASEPVQPEAPKKLTRDEKESETSEHSSSTSSQPQEFQQSRIDSSGSAGGPSDIPIEQQRKNDGPGSKVIGGGASQADVVQNDEGPRSSEIVIVTRNADQDDGGELKENDDNAGEDSDEEDGSMKDEHKDEQETELHHQSRDGSADDSADDSSNNRQENQSNPLPPGDKKRDGSADDSSNRQENQSNSSSEELISGSEGDEEESPQLKPMLNLKSRTIPAYLRIDRPEEEEEPWMRQDGLYPGDGEIGAVVPNEIRRFFLALQKDVDEGQLVIKNPITFDKYFAKAKDALNRVVCSGNTSKLEKDTKSAKIFVDAYASAYRQLDRLYYFLRSHDEEYFYSGGDGDDDWDICGPRVELGPMPYPLTPCARPKYETLFKVSILNNADNDEGLCVRRIRMGEDLEPTKVCAIGYGFIILEAELDLLEIKIADYFRTIQDLGILLLDPVKPPAKTTGRLKQAQKEHKDNYAEFSAKKKTLLHTLDEVLKTDISNIGVRVLFPANSHLAYRTLRNTEHSKMAYFNKRVEVLHELLETVWSWVRDRFMEVEPDFNTWVNAIHRELSDQVKVANQGKYGTFSRFLSASVKNKKDTYLKKRFTNIRFAHMDRFAKSLGGTQEWFKWFRSSKTNVALFEEAFRRINPDIQPNPRRKLASRAESRGADDDGEPEEDEEMDEESDYEDQVDGHAEFENPAEGTPGIREPVGDPKSAVNVPATAEDAESRGLDSTKGPGHNKTRQQQQTIPAPILAQIPASIISTSAGPQIAKSATAAGGKSRGRPGQTTTQKQQPTIPAPIISTSGPQIAKPATAAGGKSRVRDGPKRPGHTTTQKQQPTIPAPIPPPAPIPTSSPASVVQKSPSPPRHNLRTRRDDNVPATVPAVMQNTASAKPKTSTRGRDVVKKTTEAKQKEPKIIPTRNPAPTPAASATLSTSRKEKESDQVSGTSATSTPPTASTSRKEKESDQVVSGASATSTPPTAEQRMEEMMKKYLDSMNSTFDSTVKRLEESMTSKVADIVEKAVDKAVESKVAGMNLAKKNEGRNKDDDDDKKQPPSKKRRKSDAETHKSSSSSRKRKGHGDDDNIKAPKNPKKGTK